MALPGLIGLFWKLLAVLGVSHSFGLVVSVRLVMVGLALIGVEAGRRMAVKLAGPTAGLMAMLMMLFCPLEIFFAPKAMTENASGVALLVAAHLALTASPRRTGLAGALAGLVVFFRYQNGLVLVGLLILVALRDRRAALRFMLAAFVVGLAGGALDWVTWGSPFKAFISNVRFNLTNASASFGTQPVTYFTEHLERSMGAGLGLLLLGGALAMSRARGLVTIVVVYFLIHCAVPHKEVRFLLPVLPIALMLAGIGLADLRLPRAPQSTLALGVVLSVALAAHALHPTQRDFGRADNDGPLWHAGEDYVRATWEVEKKVDLCGLALVGNSSTWTGGYSYLHRNVPIYFNSDSLAATNYVIGLHDEKLPKEFIRIYAVGEYAVFRRPGGCRVVPNRAVWIN